MNRVENATQFAGQLRTALEDYNEKYRGRVAEIRVLYTHTLAHPDVDDTLEAHQRVYFINRFLGALNWQVNDRSEEIFLVPEVPLRSLRENTIRFLDYLGVESGGAKPLLLVETKRPRIKLPTQVPLSETDMPLPYSVLIAGGLHGKNLGSEWNEYLATLRDYVCSVKEQVGFAPRRVIMTNGNWLILFCNPADAFLPDGHCNPDNICIYVNGNDMVENASSLFGFLECRAVRGDVSIRNIKSAGELRFHVRPENIDRVIHGLRLEYSEHLGMYGFERPEMSVAPLLYIHAQNGDWFRYEKCEETSIHRVPAFTSSLARHLENVKTAAEALLQEINYVVGRTLRPISLVEHYADREAFATLQAVKEDSSDSGKKREYVILTGIHSHFLLPEPSVADCPHHCWQQSQAKGVAMEFPILERGTTQPRCFCPSGQLHHCAHRDVARMKACAITPLNREQCGRRSGKDGHAFCEIAPFEEHLCCRTCVFEEVCTKATVFQLPARDEEESHKVFFRQDGRAA